MLADLEPQGLVHARDLAASLLHCLDVLQIGVLQVGLRHLVNHVEGRLRVLLPNDHLGQDRRELRHAVVGELLAQVPLPLRFSHHEQQISNALKISE